MGSDNSRTRCDPAVPAIEHDIHFWPTVRPRRKMPLIVALCAVGVLVVSLFLALALAPPGGHASTGPSGPVRASYVAHAPIRIGGDSDFATQAWPGDGTAANPYVISGLDVDGGATANDCIDIRNTTVHFVVEGNYVHNPIGNYNFGAIYLRNVTNGSVSANVVAQTELAILVVYSENVTITGNNCSAIAEGAGGVSYGIYVRLSYHISVVGNYCYWDVVGGVYMRDANDCTITDNQCIDGQQYGIVMRGSSGNSIQGNNISANWINGIYMYDTPSQWNNISNNAFYANLAYGVYNSLSGSNHNRIWNNTYVDNNAAGSVYNPAYIQAFDASTGDWWNTSGTPHGYGNFWSDWQSPDNNHDGIVDSPYVLAGGGAQDYYPLTVPSQPIPEGSPLVLVSGTAFIALAILTVERKRKGR